MPTYRISVNICAPTKEKAYEQFHAYVNNTESNMIDIEEIDQMFDPLQYSDKRMKAWSKVKEAKHKQQS